MFRRQLGNICGMQTVAKPDNHIAFQLKPIPPFRLELTAWVLRRRPVNIIDRRDGQSYRRAFLVAGTPVDVAISQSGPPEAPRLQVQATGTQLSEVHRRELMRLLTDLLGIDVDLTDFYRLIARDPKLGPLVQRFRGVKPPRFPSIFEALVNAISCQQLSLAVGLTLLSRLARHYGAKVEHDAEVAYAFPEPDVLANAVPEELRRLGFSTNKVRALLELATAVTDGRLDLAELAQFKDETVLARLQELRGVGRWTAEYVLLRGLRRLYLFPGDDVGARNKLQGLLGIGEKLTYEEVHQLLKGWEPYAGLVYFHMLLDGLAQSGYLHE